jgi:hypothetical protein
VGKSANGNPNLAAIRRTVRELGGTITARDAGGRTLRLTIKTKQGAVFTYGVIRRKVDDMKLAGWLRQEFNRANAAHKRRKK